MNLPNTLTLARIFLVPLLVSVLLTKFEGRLILGLPVELVGAAIFGLASLTDWLDGYLARRRKQVTRLGQMLDPLADKLLISATLISLVQLNLAPAWMVAVIIGREFAVTGLRSLAYARGVDDAGVAARQAEDGVPGRGDPAADPRMGTDAAAAADRAGGAVGGAGDRAASRRSTTSAASTTCPSPHVADIAKCAPRGVTSTPRVTNARLCRATAYGSRPARRTATSPSCDGVAYADQYRTRSVSRSTSSDHRFAALATACRRTGGRVKTRSASPGVDAILRCRG